MDSKKILYCIFVGVVCDFIFLYLKKGNKKQKHLKYKFLQKLPPPPHHLQNFCWKLYLRCLCFYSSFLFRNNYLNLQITPIKYYIEGR